MPDSFLARLSRNQEPDPQIELERLASAADDVGHAWLALRAAGRRWRAFGGRALILARRQDNRGYLALTARITNKLDAFPADDRVAQETYGHLDGFRSFWRLENVEIGYIDAAEIPGHGTKGSTAPKALKGQSGFLYWNFGTRPRLHPRVKAATANRPQSAAPRTPKRRVTTPCEPPETPIYGVDFSGQIEPRGRNCKLWVASWDKGEIELLGGNTDHPLTRAGLRRMIAKNQGLWVVDFPFGIPAGQAAALGLQNWEAYLHWANAGQPTALRNAARVTLNAAGVPWGLRRHVDIAHRTTWFPLFEKLYRQTLLGASEILLPLRAGVDCSVRILPWETPEAGKIPTNAHWLIEGFPGHTLHGLDLPASGYKQLEHTTARNRILDALVEVGLPVDHLREAVVADGDGDAVDALLLLYSAKLTLDRPLNSWRDKKAELELNGHLSEGWFFD